MKTKDVLNYILHNIFSIILIVILIYMRMNDLYIHTETIEQPVYVETCQGTPTGYAEYNDGMGYVGGDITNSSRDWMLNNNQWQASEIS